MNMKKFGAIVAMVSLLAATPAMAAGGFDQKNLYFGAGLGSNELSGWDDATGFQVFGGYRFGEVAKNVNLALEVGYMDSGDFDTSHPVFGTLKTSAEGLWSTAVFEMPLGPQASLLGRIGLDFGDDDGLMIGIGMGFNLNKQMQLRGEYVERDNISSLQFNFVYTP